MDRIEPVRQVICPHDLHHGQFRLFANAHHRWVIYKGINPPVHAAKVHTRLAHRLFNKGWKRLFDKLAIGFGTADEGKIWQVKPFTGPPKQHP